jgi:iron complex outermembrane receptor protein
MRALLTVLLLLTPLPLGAQVADTARADSVLVLRPVEVSGARAAAVGGTSALTLRVDSLALPAAPSLEQVLRRVPMLHVRTNSRGEAELVSRGSESRQVAVLMDGIPLTLGWDARTDVSVIPADAVEQVRFTRGQSSMLHGPNVLGGVVELSVAGEHARLPRSAHLASSYDADGGYGVAGGFTMPLDLAGGDLLLRGGAGYRDSPGVPLARGVVEPAPSTSGLRANTDARAADAYAALRWRSTAGPWLSATASATRAARGIAAELDVAAPRFWRYPHVSRQLAVLSGGTGFHRTPFGTGDLEASVGYDAGRTEIIAYTDRTYTERSSFEDGVDRTLTLRLLGDHTLGTRGDLRAAFTLADIVHDETIPASSLRYRQRLWSAGAETVWRVASRAGPLRAVNVSIGGALDGASTPETGDKPAVPAVRDWGGRLGVNAYLRESVQLHAGVSRRGRFPALREAFSGALDRFAPNAELSAEHLTALEAGATAQLGHVGVQLVAFHQRLDDAIVRVALPDQRFMRVNENQLRSTGIELLASMAWRTATFGVDVAWQSARLISPSARSGPPENQPQLTAGLRAASPLPYALRASAHATFTGRQYCLAASGEDVALAPGTRAGGDIAREFRIRRVGLLSRIDARVAIDNAFDTATWDQCGLPREGRTVRFQLRLF